MTAKEAKEILDRAKKKSFIAKITQEIPYTYDSVDSIALNELREIIWDMLIEKEENECFTFTSEETKKFEKLNERMEKTINQSLINKIERGKLYVD